MVHSACKFLILAVLIPLSTMMAQRPRTLMAGDTAKGIFVGTWVKDAPEGGEALHGRPVVLEFWSTWCNPCIAAFPHINELADTFSDRYQFVAITQETRRTVEPFLETHDLRTAVAVDTEQGTTHKVFGVWAIPRTFVLSPEGVVLWTGHQPLPIPLPP
ncbi:MAG: TlpA disulfide reductase family protein, partial [Bacteroidota bacterium]|nr:TlpA disulfide reductase family protein [Bacteroidota bacterium]